MRTFRRRRDGKARYEQEDYSSRSHPIFRSVRLIDCSEDKDLHQWSIAGMINVAKRREVAHAPFVSLDQTQDIGQFPTDGADAHFKTDDEGLG